MRLLKFFTVFIGVTALVLGLVFYPNWDVFMTVYDNREAMREGMESVEQVQTADGLIAFLASHPDKVSVVSYEPQRRDEGLFYRAEEKRVMGASGNLILMTAYQRHVEQGRLTPDSLVAFSDIASYDLPGVEGYRIDRARNMAEERDWLDDGRIALDHLSALMVELNSLAVADYLYDLLGHEAILRATEAAPGSIEPPLPFSGLHLTLSPAVNRADFKTHFQELQALDDQTFRDRVLERFSRYHDDEEFRQQVRGITTGERLGLGFTEHRAMYQLFPKAEPMALARLMEQISQGTLISESASQRLADVLRWPAEGRIVEREFEDYGALFDYRMSMLNGVDFGTTLRSGQDRVQAVFLEDLPIGLWMHMSSSFLNQEFQKQLIYDDRLYESARRELATGHDAH